MSMRYRAISNVYGRIEEILLTYPGSNSGRKLSEKEVKGKYSGIWKALESRVKYYIFGNFKDGKLLDMVGRDFEAAKEKFLEEEGFELVPLVSDMKGENGKPPKNRIFAQDPFVVLMDQYGNRNFLEPYYFERAGDSEIAEQVSAQTYINIKATRYELEGGNILIGDDYAIVGADTILKNRERYFGNYTKESGERLLKKHLKKVLGVRYVIVPILKKPLKLKWDVFPQGELRQQPLYHLDLFLTLGGQNDKGQEMIYVAEMRHDPKDISYVRGKPEEPSEVQKLGRALDEIADFFKEFQDQEVGPTFDVRRIPMELIVEGVNHPVLRSYNNCLVECYGNVRNILLPAYGDHDEQIKDRSTITRRVQNKFKGDGFNVVWVRGDFDDLATKDASLHCIVKVLRRRKPKYI